MVDMIRLMTVDLKLNESAVRGLYDVRDTTYRSQIERTVGIGVADWSTTPIVHAKGTVVGIVAWNYEAIVCALSREL